MQEQQGNVCSFPTDQRNTSIPQPLGRRCRPSREGVENRKRWFSHKLLMIKPTLRSRTFALKFSALQVNHACETKYRTSAPVSPRGEWIPQVL